ncbi:MAG: PQQ-binding-like beta-propeller repeat protein [Natrialbaceae archaeon]|nr:PQQ-binding-like beta-propeller repeat protein [Natrialbaceae archaeon]
MGASLLRLPGATLLSLGPRTGTLHAVNETSGEYTWNTSLDVEIHESPIVLNDTVYVGTVNATVHAVNATTGESKWNSSTPDDSVLAPPTLVDGTIYVGTAAGTLVAMDAGTGEERWNTSVAGSGIRSSPTVFADTVFVGSDDDKVHAVNATTGSGVWTFADANNLIRSSPTVIASPETGSSVGSRVNLGALKVITTCGPNCVCHPEFPTIPPRRQKTTLSSLTPAERSVGQRPVSGSSPATVVPMALALRQLTRLTRQGTIRSS